MQTSTWCRLRVALGFLAILLVPGLARADEPAINLGYFNKLAMNGYDIMTYWRGGRPKGGGSRDILGL